MSAPSEPSDAELVAGVLRADREAFAVVYDRYGPRLYDFAYAMLRHREDAADAVADSFVSFAEKLPQLREPDRLRPWLYAITRNECLRRLKARTRVSYGDDEQLLAMPDDGITPEASAERAMLTELVWDAAAGLADRDRALLDLHLRQGLDGAELGEAMGVTAANAYVMLNRLRAQVDRSLGALLIARLGREDCTELDTLLTDWDGSFSPLIRKRVARHVDGCATCGERRRKILSPWMLLAGVPLFVAPPTLRDRVLGETQLVARTSGPVQVGPGASRPALWNRGRGIAAAAVLVAAAGVTAVVVSPNDADEASRAGAWSSAPLTSAPAGSASSLPSQAPAPGPTPAASPSTSAPTVAAAGTITASTRTIDLGLRQRRSTVTLGTDSEQRVRFTAGAGADWLSVSPSAGSVINGVSTSVVITADRTRVPEGPATGRIRLTWDGGSTTITVRLRQENGPRVARPGAPAGASCSLPVTVSASDESGVASVQLRWTGPDGTSGTVRMQTSGGRWEATIEPIQLGGTYTLRATATDTRGNTATGPALRIDVNPCPG